MSRDDRIVITRQGASRLGGLVGAIAFLIALALLLWNRGMAPAGWAALLVALAGGAAWVFFAPGEARDRITGPQARHLLGSLLLVLVLIAAVIALYTAVAGSQIALDMTLPQSFTLSPPVLDVLARLDRPVRLTGFYSPQTLALRDHDDAIFHLFEAASNGLFSVAYIDPTADPLMANAFGSRVDGSAYLTYLDPGTGGPDLSAIEEVSLGAAQERGVANALLRLMAAGQFKVYFTTGHGEPATGEATYDSISGIYDGLAAQGILTDTLSPGVLAAGVPEDATAVMIAGPRNRFTQAEVDALAAYLDRGGGMFLAANAPIAPEEVSLDAADPLRAYLRDVWGLIPQDDLVVDEVNSYQSPVNVLSTQIIDHPVTARLSEALPVVFFAARSIDGVPYENQPEALARVGRNPILITSNDAFGETNLDMIWSQARFERDAGDHPGPLGLAAVAENADTGGRIVLTGDADFLRNANIGLFGNRYFYTDALAWLTEFFEQVEIEPVNDPTRLPIAVTDETLNRLFALTVLFLPGAVLVTGFVVWSWRGRR